MRLGPDHNRVRDLRPLAGLGNLKMPSLWGNEVSDLKPLAGLSSLRYLILRGNQVRDLQPLAGRHFPALALDDNPIDCQAHSATMRSFRCHECIVEIDCP